MWFRVELDRDGSVKSCECVEASQKDGRLVRFVEAETKALACDYAKTWWEKHKKRCRETARINSEKRFALGLCHTCGGPKKKGELKRSRCLRCAVKWNKRRAALAAGAPKLNRKYQKSEDALLAMRSQQRAYSKAIGYHAGLYYRAALLRFDEMGPVSFREWLVSEINKRSDADHQIPTEKAQAAE